MSDVLENENGRIGEIDAPASTREKNAGFDVGAHENAEDATRITPSFTDHKLLAAHHAAGHELIPLHDKDAVGFGGKRTGKHPLHKGWPTETPMTAEESVSHMLGGGNVGVRLRDTDLVIDVDPRNFEADDDPVARLWRDFVLPDCPFVRTGGGGFHFLYAQAFGRGDPTYARRLYRHRVRDPRSLRRGGGIGPSRHRTRLRARRRSDCLDAVGST